MKVRDFLPLKMLSTKSSGDLMEKAGVVLLLFYLLAGFIYSALLAPTVRFPDEKDYLALSSNMLKGAGYSLDGIHLTAYRPPGYPFFLSAITALGGGFFSFRAAQFLLVGATIILVSRICAETKLFARLFVVTGLVICYPALFYTSGTLYPQTLSAFLFILAITLTLANPRGWPLNLAAGLTFGALVLSVPTFLFTIFITLGAAWGLGILRWRDALIISLVSALLIGTWTARNAVCFHRLVPIASNSGVTFLMGNNGQSIAYEGVVNIGMKPYYEESQRLGLNEFESDHFYQQAALSWIEAHPGQALLLYFEKALNFFNIWNAYASTEEVSTWKQVVMAASYILLMALLIWRLSDWKRFPVIQRDKLFLAIYVLSAFSGAIFVTRIRYRLPYDYLIIAVIAPYLCQRLKSGFHRRQTTNDDC